MSNAISHRLFSLETPDKQLLFAQEWKPSRSLVQDSPKPIIGIVHGLGEHSGRYASVANYFVKHGYHVVSYDHRGHGKTGGTMPKFETLQNDIQCLHDYANIKHQSPLILYGQSLGGTLVLKYLAKQSQITESPSNRITCAIASSPLLTPTHTPPRWKIFLGELLLPWLPKLQLAHGLKPHDLTHDTIIVEQFRQDPLVRRTVSIALGHSMLKAGEQLLMSPPDFHVPLLLMHGDIDPITSAQSTRAFAAQARIKEPLKIWNNLLHELHFEENATDVLEYVRAFIQKCKN